MAGTILVIDSGGTKSDWALYKDGAIEKGTSEGMHPNFLDENQLIENARTIEIAKEIQIDQIFFYGAGCANQKNVTKIRKALDAVFTPSEIIIEHDLLGAAKAGLGSEAGYVVILGTGSVGAYYDGRKIKEFTGGLGYLFGDEGSGAFLGKTLLLKWFKKQLSKDLAEALQKYLGLNQQETIASIYQNKRPNQKLAELTYWIKENESHEEIQKIIHENFVAFEKELLLPMIKGHDAQKVVFIGGVAQVFFKSIQIILKKYNLNGVVIQKPIDLLVQHHIQIS